MKCSRAKKLIPIYVDSRLSEVWARELQAHIDSCSQCRRESDGLRAALAALDVWEAPEPRLGFDALLARLEAPEVRRAKGSLWPVPRWAAAGLAVASVACGVYFGAYSPQAVRVECPSQQQVVAAMGLQSFDDVMEASLLHGVSSSDGTASEGGASK